MLSQRKSQLSNSIPNEETDNNQTTQTLIPPPPRSPVLHSSPLSSTLLGSLKAILFASWTNILLIFIPFGFIATRLNWSNISIFILNFLAIIPLSNLFEFAVENIGLRVGALTGSFLNFTFGNAVELIVSVIVLKQGQIRVVQASILGSIVSNLLLVLGMCFVAGGIYNKTQSFNMTTAQTSSSLITLACISLIVPAALVSSTNSLNDIKYEKGLLNLSHGMAIILLIIYVLFIFFYLKTHSCLYLSWDEYEKDEHPQLTLIASLLLLAVVAVFVAFSAEYLAGSIDGIVKPIGLTETFIGLILIPNISKITEIVSIVRTSTVDADRTIREVGNSSMSHFSHPHFSLYLDGS
ncbi:hypothetical protein RclHR1_07870006 [Rhizophagus clarus]|uniref:Vacuolar calcium ion transporter n=1 Tax=Rhizophagus clarus TaxID=94130 RepID=A0A2Z6S539_9GLOM|nr:hypothetical protein RclHR1_07870006 [Rhizophagus clarus]